MLEDMNMDASSAQENIETGQILPPRQMIQDHEFGARSLVSEATEAGQPLISENVKKGTTEAKVAEEVEQLGHLRGDLTRDSGCDQLGPQLDDAMINSHSEQLGLLPEDAAGQNVSASKASLEPDPELVPESVYCETFMEKQKVVIDHELNGLIETGTGHLTTFKSTEATAAEGIEQLGQPHDVLTRNSSGDRLGQQLEDATMNSNSEQLGIPPEDASRKNISASTALSEPHRELVPESLCSETLAVKQKEGIEYVQNGLVETGEVELDDHGLEQNGPNCEDVMKNSCREQLRPPPEDERKSSLEQLGLSDAAVNASLEQLKLPVNESKSCDAKQLESPPHYEANNASSLGGRGRRTSNKSMKGKHALRSSVGSARVLRSRVQEKPKSPEQNNNLAEHSNGSNGERRRKKRKKRSKDNPVDEFSSVRTHLRYLLHRMKYEQSLIDAYSGEGWKGQSLEKIKPEKELQRAKSEIFRRKLKIRDLFQRLDLSIAEGRFPESLYDSEGQIDSEDIFCAKCRGKDLPADNDIILCDGACERGFHQFCLVPPLLKEDIPPGDEGWLCPGCDCKVDCIATLNDSQGTNLSVLDTWEKVFPEAAAGAAGNKLDDNLGLPSDDSEDNEYDPDGSEVEEKVEGEESSSDESDFYTASEDNGASPKSKNNMELPSDDSEDDEYDPNAPDIDEQVKQESSSSDFTSDSEDFGGVVDNYRSSCKKEPVPDEPMSGSSDHTKLCGGSNGERVVQKKKQSLNEELSSLLESGPNQGESAPVSGKRRGERLDYKKLYDDTYGNASSDSSDENWMDAADTLKKRRKRSTEKVASESPGGKTPILERTNVTDIMHNQEESGHTPRRRVRKKPDVEGNNNSPANTSKRGSTASSTEKSAYRRLGEAVTQGLLKSFKENQYPEMGTKENLARDLGITVHQVSKWFENARWSFRHTSRLESRLAEVVPSKSTLPQMNQSEPGPQTVTESSMQGSTTPRGRKRGRKSDHQESDHIPSIEETRKPSAPVDLAKPKEVRKRGRPPKSQELHKRARPPKNSRRGRPRKQEIYA